MISTSALASLLPEYLPRQRWFGAKDRTIEMVTVDSCEVMRAGWPGLVRIEASVSLAGGDERCYQLFVGLRRHGEPAEFLRGHEPAVLGEVDSDDGLALAYDGLLDGELALAILPRVAPDVTAKRVRPAGAEQSNTSLIYDDSAILKVFRRLTSGHNPDVEVTEALWKVGFTHVAEPLGHWRREPFDLAFCQRFLAGGAEGWALALASLRDLYDEPIDPTQAGGDFGGEARRLGEVTALLHLAMAEAFGRHPAATGEWADLMESQVKRVLSGDEAEAARGVVGRLRGLDDPGPAIRVHGDYHLGQVMRTDAGWYVLDFEGEPARPLEERTRPTSPMKDVSGMLRSFHYAPAVVSSQREEDVSGLAKVWEVRNREAFLEGYLPKATDGGLIPADEEACTLLLTAWELDKAVYEVAYEQAHRPDWIAIPMEAVRRLVEL